MSNKKSGEDGFLDNWRGLLFTAFQHSHFGAMLGIHPLSNHPISKRVTQGINEAVRDTVRDAVAGITWLTTDKVTANKYADEVEQFWRNNINRYDPSLGQAEFRMAVGWKIPTGIAYNGVVDPKRDNQEITRMDAVFYRNEKGQVEILDARDPKYTNLVAPYIAAQIMIPTCAAKAVGAAIAAITTIGKVASIAAQGINVSGKVAGPAHTIGGVGFGVSMGYSNLVLRPEAIDRIGRLLDDPSKMKPSILREELNKIFEQYSYLNGPMSEQYFIPSIKANEDPIKRLEDLSRGVLRGIFESRDPFNRIDPNQTLKSDVQLTESRNQVKMNPYFLRGFYKLSIKAISGETMSESEMLAFKTGMNIYFGRADNIELDQSKMKDPKNESIKLLEKFRILYGASDYEILKDEPLPSKADEANKRVLDLLKTQLQSADLVVLEKERPKNPIVQNRIEHPFAFN